MKRILIAGNDGYIGSALKPFLQAAGLDVIGLDTGFYRDALLYSPRTEVLPPVLNLDVRAVAEDVLGAQQIDAVVYLAELSNDPLGELDPATTRDNNCGGCARMVDIVMRLGIRRAEVVYRDRLLPIGIAEGCTLQRDVKAGEVLSYDDVELPKGRLRDELRTWQENQYQTWKISEKCR